MSKGPWRELAAALWRRTDVRASTTLIALFLASALFADCIASDKPIIARWRGELYVLPALSGALASHDLASLESVRKPGDWMLSPLVPWGPNQQDKGRPALEAPSGRHLLGTDAARRDVLARLVHGSRVALAVGVIAVSIYISVGTLLGLLAAYFGGWVDALISRLTEMVLTVPVFFLILAVLGVIEGAGIFTLMVVMGLVLWTRVARLVRAEAMQVVQKDFILAARALGYSTPRILLRHVLPNVSGPILVSASFGMASAVGIEAALTFLGFGTPEATASWGSLLHGAMSNLHAWWLVLTGGVAIFALVLAYNLLGEALRDVLDPRNAEPPPP